MKRNDFIELALSYLKCPAVNYCNPDSGISPDGFDNTGFVNFILVQAGYPQNIPRHVNELFDSFGLPVHNQLCMTGDLIFFCNKEGEYPNHIGILISRSWFVHSPGKNSRDVCIKKIKYQLISPVKKGKQMYHANPIGIKRISVDNGRRKEMFLLD